MVHCPRDGDDPAPRVRAGHSRNQRRTRHRHHRDARPPRHAGRRGVDLQIERVDARGREPPARLDDRVPPVAHHQQPRAGGGEEREQPRDLVRRPGGRARAVHRQRGSRPAHTRRIARADRAADRARRPPAARARTHPLVGLQHLQPARVLRSGDARPSGRRRSVELHDRGRAEPAQGARLSGAVRCRREEVAGGADHAVSRRRIDAAAAPRGGRVEGTEVRRAGGKARPGKPETDFDGPVKTARL